MDEKLQTATKYQLTKQTLYFINMLEAHQKAMFEVLDFTASEELHFQKVFNNKLDELLEKELTVQNIHDTMAKNKFF